MAGANQRSVGSTSDGRRASARLPERISKPILHNSPQFRVREAEFLRRQDVETFDLIFADAMLGKYELLDEALALLRPGGLYVIDDMLPQDNWPEGHAPRVPRLIADLAGRSDFRIVSLAWSSGLVVVARQL